MNVFSKLALAPPLTESAPRTGQDVNEQMMALQRETERLQSTLASIGDGVIRTDASGRIDYLNPTAERLTGWHAADAVGRPLGEIFQVVDEVTRLRLADPVQSCLKEGKTVESPGHVLLIGADGAECAIRDAATPVFTPAGRPD